MKIPCEGCLILPICKELLREADQDLQNKWKGHAGWVILKETCSIIKDYLKEIGYFGEWNINLGEFEETLIQIYGKAYQPSIKYGYYKINKSKYEWSL
jgi:hypothetical protein